MKRLIIFILSIILLFNNSFVICSKESNEPIIWEDLLVEKIEDGNSILYNASFKVYNLSDKIIKSISIQFHNYNEANHNLPSNFEANDTHTATINGIIKPSEYCYVGDLYLTGECKYIHVDKIIIRYVDSSKKEVLSYNHKLVDNKCVHCIDFSHYI